jgi:fumarylacetoacetase
MPSGTPVRRPLGQTKGPDDAAPSFTPCRLLDFELEMVLSSSTSSRLFRALGEHAHLATQLNESTPLQGLFVGPGNALGDRVPIDEAENHMFGVVLLNDWSGAYTCPSMGRWSFELTRGIAIQPATSRPGSMCPWVPSPPRYQRATRTLSLYICSRY